MPDKLNRFLNKAINAFLLLLITISPLYAQSVIIKSKKTIYTRTGEKVPDFKLNFEIEYPVFSGPLDPKVLERLKEGTDYWKIFDMSLEDSLKDDYWLDSCVYEVKYNNNYILSMILFCDGSAAYPSTAYKYLNFDLKTGNNLTFSELFSKDKIQPLTAVLRRKMLAREQKLKGEAKQALRDQRRSYPDIYPPPQKIQLRNFAGYTVSERGITFIYNYGYPHVIQALEPDGNFFLTYAELKAFVNSNGLLRSLAR